jgi:hypothetical protein
MDDDCCGICGGTLGYLGTLGSVDWYQCRQCGNEVMVTEATDDEIIAEYMLGVVDGATD